MNQQLKPHLAQTDASSRVPSREIDLSSFAAFKQTFPLQGGQLYATLFDAHADIVQTQKARFAVANLEKIFTATFAISATSGFDKMSLRDLSSQAGMSMGAIYSCISKKDDIALMVAEIVRRSSQLTREYAMQESSLWLQIEQSIRFHLYASSLLQPWYFFLYFETRSLPESQQAASTKIELDAIDNFEKLIQRGKQQGEFKTRDARMVANTIVVLLEDWYLKPWKTHSASRPDEAEAQREKSINNYHTALTGVVADLLAVQ